MQVLVHFHFGTFGKHEAEPLIERSCIVKLKYNEGVKTKFAIVYISQLVRFARCCTSVLDFHSKNLKLLPNY